jgi:hypothetical protein
MQVPANACSTGTERLQLFVDLLTAAQRRIGGIAEREQGSNGGADNGADHRYETNDWLKRFQCRLDFRPILTKYGQGTGAARSRRHGGLCSSDRACESVDVTLRNRGCCGHDRSTLVKFATHCLICLSVSRRPREQAGRGITINERILNTMQAKVESFGSLAARRVHGGYAARPAPVVPHFLTAHSLLKVLRDLSKQMGTT